MLRVLARIGLLASIAPCALAQSDPPNCADLSFTESCNDKDTSGISCRSSYDQAGYVCTYEDEDCSAGDTVCLESTTVFGGGVHTVDTVDALSCGSEECFASSHHILTMATAGQLAAGSTCAQGDTTGWCSDLDEDLRINVLDYLGGPEVLDNFGGEGEMKYQNYMAVIHAVKVYTGGISSSRTCQDDGQLGNDIDCIDTVEELHEEGVGTSPADVCAVRSDIGAPLHTSGSRCIQGTYKSESDISFIPYTDVVVTRVEDTVGGTVSPPTGFDISPQKSVMGMSSAQIILGDTLQLKKSELHCPSKAGTNNPIDANAPTCAQALQCASGDPAAASVTGHKCSKYGGPLNSRFKRAAEAGIPPPEFRGVPGYFDLIDVVDCDTGRFDSPTNVIYGYDSSTTGTNADGISHDGFKCLYNRDDTSPLEVTLNHDEGTDSVNLHDVLWYAPSIYEHADDSTHAWMIRTTLIAHVDMIFGDLQSTQNDFTVPTHSLNLGYYVDIDEVTSNPMFVSNGFQETDADDGASEGYFGFYSRACLDATSVHAYSNDDVSAGVQAVKCLRQSVEPFLFHITKVTAGSSQAIQVQSVATASQTSIQLTNVDCHHFVENAIDYAFLTFDVTIHGYDESFNNFRVQKITLRHGSDRASGIRLAPGSINGNNACDRLSYPGIPCINDSVERDGEFSASSSLRAAIGPTSLESSCTTVAFAPLGQAACFDALSTAASAGDLEVEIEYSLEIPDADGDGVVLVLHHVISCDNLFCASVQTGDVVERLTACLDQEVDSPSDMSITSSVQLYSQSMSVISRLDAQQYGQLTDANRICPLHSHSDGEILPRCPTLLNEQCDSSNGGSVRSLQQVQIACGATHYEHLDMNALETHQENPSDPVGRAAHIAAVSNTEAHVVTGNGLGYAFLGTISAPSYAPITTMPMRQQVIFPVGAVLSYNTGGSSVPINLFGTMQNGAWKMTPSFWAHAIGMPTDIYTIVKGALETHLTGLLESTGDVLIGAEGVHIDSDRFDTYAETQSCVINGLPPQAFASPSDTSAMCAQADFTCSQSTDPQAIVVGDPTHNNADSCGHGSALSVSFNSQPYLYGTKSDNSAASDLGGACFPDGDRASFTDTAGSDCTFQGSACQRTSSFRGCGLWPMDDPTLFQGSSYTGQTSESFFEVFKSLTRNQRLTMASAVGVTINDAYLAQSANAQTTWNLQVQYAHIGNLDDFGLDGGRRLQITTETVNHTLAIARPSNGSEKQDRRVLQDNQDSGQGNTSSITASAAQNALPCVDRTAPVVDGLFQSACVCTTSSESTQCLSFYESQNGPRPSDDDSGMYAGVEVETNSAGTFVIIALLVCGGVLIAQRMRHQEELVVELKERLYKGYSSNSLPRP